MTRSRTGRAALAAAVLVLALAALAVAWMGRGPDLAPWHALDTRWGTYLSEREWGTPREALGAE